MRIIEPCCARKDLLALRSRLGEDGTVFFHGYGDLSLAELLPALLTRYSEAELMIVAPSLPDGAAKVIRRMMEKQLTTIDGKGKRNVIASLTIIAGLSEKRSPMASQWLGDNPFPGRLVLRDVQQNDTAVILPDIALYGPLNLVYGGHFTAVATRNARTIAILRKAYARL